MNSWFIQPTAIWGHDMVFSRSPFLPPRLRQPGQRSQRDFRIKVVDKLEVKADDALFRSYQLSFSEPKNLYHFGEPSLRQ